jgi:hypothetical protein
MGITTVNGGFTETVALPASVNQIGKRKKKTCGQAQRAHPRTAAPLAGSTGEGRARESGSASPLIGSVTPREVTPA